MFRLLLASLLSAAALIAISTGASATATVAPPQCLTNLVANVVAGKPTVLPPAPCSDPDGDALTILLVDGPTHGVLGAQGADGTRIYTADTAYVGTDVVHFKASDGSSESAVSTLTINVHPASATTPPGLNPPVPPAPHDVEPATDPLDPSRCVGRGVRNVQNGLLVGSVYRKPLQVFRPDGSGVRFITRLRPGRYIHVEPAWSPDGRQVAFSNGSASTQSIWRVDVASGRERRVTRSTVDSWPAWSPDGRWIAFFRGQLVSGQRVGLWAVRPDGTGERPVFASSSDTAVGASGPPSWSPNGRCLAVPVGGGLAIVDSQGGGHRMVLRWSRRFVEVPTPPSWSRDGRRLAFAGVINRAPFNKSRLLSINVDGTGERSITSSRTAKAPLFSPDGRTLVYSDRRGVYSTPARGGRARLIAPKRSAYAWGPRRR